MLSITTALASLVAFDALSQPDELKKGVRIIIDGVVDSQFYKVSDDKDYHVIPNTFNVDKDHAPWGDSDGNVGDYSKTSGMLADSTLHIRAENTLGLYGADVQIKVPSTRGTGISGVHSRGAHIFAGSKYGDIKAGFQDGAETMMRVDASSIAAGDGGADSNWFRKTNLEGEKGNFPFHVAPRLYSESLSMESNWLSFRDAEKYGKDFIDAQPFRLSYYSPSLMGFKFGVSYSPNYDGDLFSTGGSVKAEYIDPSSGTGNPKAGEKVSANFLNYKWYNTASAAYKAARKLKDVNSLRANTSGRTARPAAAAALAIAEGVYNEARTYNNTLPEIPADINNPNQIGNVGDGVALEIADVNIRALVTNIVTARQKNDETMNAAPFDDPACVAARETVINTGQAIARIAALASSSAVTDTANLPDVNNAPHPAIAEIVVENAAISNHTGNGFLDSAIALRNAADARAAPNASATVRGFAENAAIAAFRAAATAQGALGVDIGTAKEVYMLLATSGNYVGPNYENIVSGGVSYEYDFDDLKIKVSATGETGKIKGMNEKVGQYDMYGKYNDLAAYNLGFSADYMGIKFAASYANLGKSGQPKSICTKNALETGKTDYTYTCNEDKVKGLQKDTYYWTAGAGYEFDDIYVSATYFKSKSVEAHELSDFILGAQYNLSSAGSQSSFVPYVTWHHFTTKEKDLSNDKKYNKGDLFLAGVKFTF